MPDLIVVRVNNRLGKKAEIPCFPTDTIGDFKKIASHMLGLKAENILLKRQGMRPFKNNLTSEDYEIGNGSSLDLEIDIGD